MPGTPRIGVVALLLSALGGGWYLRDRDAGSPEASTDRLPQALVAEDPARKAFESRARGRIITVYGTVERMLADDRDGSPHQRFIIRTTSGLSLLIAHNLDLAPRVEGLGPGEAVTVLGEYEWNEKGGVMHWTHDDPQGRHPTGYIEWRGRRYE